MIVTLHRKWFHSAVLGIVANFWLTNLGHAQDQDRAATVIQGRLDKRSSQRAEPYDNPAIQLVGGKRYEVSVQSRDFDPKTALLAPDGEVIGEDDDGGEGNSSLLDFSADRTGTYRVRITSAGESNEQEVQRYSLTVRELRPLPSPLRATAQNKSPLDLETYSGRLGPEDAEVNGRYVKDYLFHLERSQTALIFLDSDDMDPVLQIFTLQGRGVGHELDQDDDDGADTNAFLSFTAEESGDYVIRALSIGEKRTGTYALRIAIVP